MSDLPQLSTDPPAQISMDFARLLKDGLAFCQQFGGTTWTDYNEHDPGVTILEQLCYALTDAGYRCSYDVADILAEQPDAGTTGNTTLFTGDQILTGNPLTINDYRKLLIDRARSLKWSNFKNVWLQNPSRSKFDDSYDVWIEVYDSNQDNSLLLEDLRSVFLAHRNLCEGLASLSILTMVMVEPQASIEIDMGYDQNAVLAGILFAIQNMLVPTVRVDSPAQYLERAMPPDEIYLGPLLNEGVIDDATLQPKVASISLSDIANAVQGVAGVLGITDLRVSVGPLEISGGTNFPIRYDQIARLQPSIFSSRSASRFTLTRQGAVLTTDPVRVANLIATLLAEAAGQQSYAPNDELLQKYITLEQGSKRDIAHYYSLQRQFPQTYGIGVHGLASHQPQTQNDVNLGIARAAQARQLKAYLLHFEQMLSNSQQQLASAARLFSLESELDRSYFYQSLLDSTDGPPDLVPLLLNPGVVPPVEDEFFVVCIHDCDVHATPMLESGVYATQEAATRAAQRILTTGSETTNYRVYSDEHNTFQLRLEDSEAPGFGCQHFDSEDDAEGEIDMLAFFVKTLQGDESLRQSYLRIERRGSKRLRLLDDKGEILFAVDGLTESDRAARVQSMLGCGLHIDRYEVYGDDDRRCWRVRLLNRKSETLADGGPRYATRGSAESAVKADVALFQALCRDPALQAVHFQYIPPPPDKPQPPSDDEARIAAYLNGLKTITADNDPYTERRNRFLDHLLARFGEHFENVTLGQLDPCASSDETLFAQDLISWKCTFLQRYVRVSPQAPVGDGLGSGRSRGLNLHPVATPPDSAPGLAKRMALQLGIPDASGDIAMRYTNDEAVQPPAVAAGAEFLFSSAEPAVLRRLLRDGRRAEAYQVVETDAGRAQVLFQWADENVKHEVFSAASKAEAQRALAGLMTYLRTLPQRRDRLYSGEKFFVLEHVLLRPASIAQPTPATDDGQTCDTCDDDFFLFRVSIIFPAAPARFQDPAFRSFAQQIAEQNCPAHVDARCVWLDSDAMKKFEVLHTNWLTSLSLEDPAQVQPQHAADLLAFLRHCDSGSAGDVGEGAA